MRAMILAAGAGTRMGELTQHTAKPLLPVRGKPLISYLIEQMAQADFSEIVINLYHFPQQFEQCIGKSNHWGIPITFSYEKTVLGPAGGVINALPLFGDEPFLVVSGDIWTNYPFAALPSSVENAAHCVLVPNPDYHREGDFGLTSNKRLSLAATPRYTYGNMGVFTKAFFEDAVGVKEFGPLFERAIAKKQITGELYHGAWYNVGTPEQLNALNAEVAFL